MPASSAARMKITHTGGCPVNASAASVPAETAVPACATQQDAAAVDAVGERSAEEVDDDHRPELGRADQPDERGRVRQRVDLEGHGDQRRLGAEAGDDRAELDDAVVARAAERGDVGGDRGTAGPRGAILAGAPHRLLWSARWTTCRTYERATRTASALAADLREHFAAGRLTQAELGERLDATYARERRWASWRAARRPARPAPAAGARAARDLARRRIYQDAGAVVILNVGCVAVWAAGGGGSFWPEWVMLVSGLRLLRDGWRLLGPAAAHEPSGPRRGRRDRRRLPR